MDKKKKIRVEEPKLIKNVNEDTNMIKKFVYILIGVSLITVLIYFLTSKFLIDDEALKDDEPSVTITYNDINVGNIFNRPYDVYYVLAYDSKDNRATYFESLKEDIKQKEGEQDTKVYFLDLSNKLNKKYVGETANKKASTVDELVLTNPNLIVIKNGKISNYYASIDEIESYLNK